MSGLEPGAGLATRYSLVPMEPSHLDEVTAIERMSYSNPWRREAFQYEIGKNPRSWARVAITTAERPEVAGYCVCWVVFDEFHIQNVTVHPAHRRRGLGRLLLLDALDEGAARGATTALLEVRRSNLAAQRLYRALGFREVGTRKNYYSQPLEDAVLLQKDRIPAAEAT